MVRSLEVAGPSNLKLFIWPNGMNLGCFQLHILQDVDTSMPSLTSQSLVILPAVCLAGQVGTFNFTDHPSIHGHQTGL